MKITGLFLACLALFSATAILLHAQSLVPQLEVLAIWNPTKADRYHYLEVKTSAAADSCREMRGTALIYRVGNFGEASILLGPAMPAPLAMTTT
jgi:hypothetical protein